MRDYRRLIVWQKSHELTLSLYRLTRTFPDHEKYGLISQMRRCAVSIPSNIAEGSGRETGKDFARFCQIAMGSACELNYQCLLSHELGYISDNDYRHVSEAINEVQKLLTAFGNSLNPKSAQRNNKSRNLAIGNQPQAKRQDPNS